jgi:hypothetical protein
LQVPLIERPVTLNSTNLNQKKPPFIPRLPAFSTRVAAPSQLQARRSSESRTRIPNPATATLWRIGAGAAIALELPVAFRPAAIVDDPTTSELRRTLKRACGKAQIVVGVCELGPMQRHLPRQGVLNPAIRNVLNIVHLLFSAFGAAGGERDDQLDATINPHAGSAGAIHLVIFR